MQLPRNRHALAAALALSVVSQAHAAFQAVETFDALNNGSIGGQNGWVVTSGSTTSVVTADPSVPSNKVLQHTGANDAYKLLPASIADASGGTYFLRVRLAGATNDVSFGLSDVNPPSLTDFATFEVQPNVAGNSANFGSRDGGTNRTPLFTMTTNVWYNFWFVIDTTADTYRIYVQRDGDSSYSTQTELTSSDGTWNFRNAAAANPLVAFVLLSNNGNGANTNIYLDDIYIDPVNTPNLVNPLTLTPSDTDGDGLLDSWEKFYFGNDLNAQNGSGDPDSDGFTNEQEETAASNPTLAASTPLDVDGDGLADSWEVTYFTNTTSQNGAGDFDGDGATNEQEETANTNPADASNWPDSDGDGLNDAWEVANFTNITAQTGSGDFDGDGASNYDEMRAGSDPKNINWTPTKALLTHRWSFNGDLNDSVGTSNATIVDPDNNAAVGGTVTQNATSVTLSGGASGTSAAVRLGGNLVGARSTPVTIELWATPVGVQNWGRIFDFGSGTTEYLFMSWTRGTDAANDQVEWIDSGVATNRGTTNATSYTLGTQYHIVLTLTPASYSNGAATAGTRVTWYITPSIATGTVVAKGSFTTANTLPLLNDVDNWLGRSMWAGDNVANATYDEVRIWNGALTSDEINTYQLAGPNSFTFVDTDSDGLSDPWEQAYFNSLAQSANGDPDADGYTNSQEYAGGSNPTSKPSIPGDVDGDGLPDNWEVQYFGNLSQIATADPDGDLATNLQEYVGGSNPNSNTSYPDNDFDFLNDAWEIRYFGNITAYGQNDDPDGDGYNNNFEFSNGYDPTNYLSSPDSDSDTLADGWEVHYFKQTGEDPLNDLSTILGRNSGTDDPDTDGFNNSLEFAYGTNPTLATSVPGDLNNDGVSDGPVLKAGGDAGGTTSFDAALNWSDASIPTAGKTYIVGVAGLRTPATGSPTFAGDKLVLTAAGTNVGSLIWKTDSAVTIPVLQLDGGLINHAATGGVSVTLNGTIQVSKNSTLFANNGPLVINSTLSGSGNLALTGGGNVTFAGNSTWNGSLDIAGTTNRFILASTGTLLFKPGAVGVTNAITGTGGFTLNGAFTIDTSAAATTLGNSWTLTANTGPKVYASTFHVTGYSPDSTTAGTRKWTSNTGPNYYRFDEATGVLTVVSNPDTDFDGLADAWEIQYFGSDLNAQNGSGDPDGDGATNAQEYAAGSNPTSNTSWPDSDADGVNDAWELTTFGNLTTATATDKDGDGLLDAYEVAYFGNITAQNGSGDADSDGFTNEAEETAGSNANLAASTPLAGSHRLLAADALGATSFNSALNWEGGVAPAAGQSYSVNIQSLRTPADANAYTFAGDQLVIFYGGNLLIKGSGALTFPGGNLVLDGGRFHNGTDGNVAVTVEGGINVRSASEIYAQNGAFVFNSVLSGSGTLTLTGANMVTLAGANSYRGNVRLNNTAGLTLASTGSLTFAPGAIASTNAITGTNPAVLNGTFVIDTTSASTASGASWTLVATTGAKTYGATFNVSGFTSDGAAAGSRKWTKGVYQFDEATHTLSVVGAPLSALQSWRVTHFGNSANSGNGADSADPDNDGRANLLEYATGTLPNSADSGSVVTVARSGNALTLSFAHIGDTTLSYVVEASNDLATWSTAQTYTGFATAGTTTYTDNVTLTSGARRFLRLKVTAP